MKLKTTRCTHATLTVLSGPGEIVIETGDAFELCYEDTGFLVMNFEGHDGGGIVFGPAEVAQLKSLLQS